MSNEEIKRNMVFTQNQEEQIDLFVKLLIERVRKDFKNGSLTIPQKPLNVNLDCK